MTVSRSRLQKRLAGPSVARWLRISCGIGISCLISIPFLLSVPFLVSVQSATVDQTTGGINWIDPAPYKKPAFVSIAVPNEASSPKYYVDLGSGSGSTCTQAAPCGLLSVAGKPGTSGGPAYVYIKGTGAVNIYNPSAFFGAAGSEIVIKPWPAGTTGCPSGCTATITSSAVNNITGSNLHHWIFDGGPDMGIILQTTSAGDNVALRVNSNNHTIYRVQGRCAPSGQGGNEVLKTSEGQATGLRVINSEFYGCLSGSSANQQSAIYMGGSSCNDNGSGFTNFLWQNNIVRDMGGEGVELNPRTNSSGALITGNAFHNIGKQTCGPSWDCRPAITIDGPDCGGIASNVVVTNNLMWDLGSACIWTKGGAGGNQFNNNTCYNYGVGSSNGACNQGICGGTTATVKNNIIYTPNGKNPFDGTSFTASNNLCGSGKSCGGTSRVWSATTVMATVQTDQNFLKISSSSEATGSGVNLFSSGVTVDYAGLGRSSSGAFDIGAFLSGAGSPVGLAAPTGLRIVR